MSGLDCKDPNHERCETCTGCVSCGCVCHLAGEDQSETDLVILDMGLRAFVPFTGDNPAHCPKCLSNGLQVVWHQDGAVMSLGESTPYPCEDWVQRGLLTGMVGEHLCIRCRNCGYGWPSHTADV